MGSKKGKVGQVCICVTNAKLDSFYKVICSCGWEGVIIFAWLSMLDFYPSHPVNKQDLEAFLF